MKSPPYYSQFSSASKRVYEALDRRSSLAWPILKKQCEIAKLDPINLQLSDLKKVVPGISQALSSFTTPEKGVAFENEILAKQTAEAQPLPRISNRIFRARSALNPVSARAIEVLGEITPMARPVLEAQCARAGIAPVALTTEQLEILIDKIEKGISRLSSPSEGLAAREKLLALTEELSTLKAGRIR